MAYIEIIILSAVALFSLYKWSVSNYHILRDRGIPHHKPTALIGNFNMNVLLGKSSFMKFIIDNYSDFKSRFVHYFVEQFVIELKQSKSNSLYDRSVLHCLPSIPYVTAFRETLYAMTASSGFFHLPFEKG